MCKRVLTTAEELLARSHGENRHVSERMHTLVVFNRQSTVQQYTALAVLGVNVVVGGTVGSLSRRARTVLVNLPVLAAVGVSHQTLEQSVTGIPVRREVAVSVGKITSVDVL
jgi:hypothetical protein